MKEFWNKYRTEIIMGLLIVALLFVSTCSHNSQLKAEGEKKQLVKELSLLQEAVKTQEHKRDLEKDSLDKDIAKKQITIDSLVQKDKENKQKIADISKQLNKKRQEVKNYNAKQVAEFLNKRYDTNTTVATDSTITAVTDVGKKVTTELVEKDACEETNKVQQEQLSDKDKVIAETKGQLQDTSVKLNSAEDSIKLLKEAEAKSDVVRKVDNKIIRSLKTQNTVKWILIPAAFVGGLLIAK